MPTTTLPTAPLGAPGSASSPAVDDLAARLRPAVLRVSRRLRAEKADDELSDSQSAILGYLQHNGPSTPGTLATFERVTPPSMNRTINAVVDAGYAERSPSADDGRKVVVSLTAEGQALVAETRRRRDAWLDQRLAELSPQERSTLESAAIILRQLADS
ncbi:MarR family winged helix-turn-helix transcriptional regulator [Subtercola boreus]|uniref:MarR family transcriptional regulator n=1 Tax=Subtercola boreus TaxID=120213 RepID=A0A3E0WC12_9MICO|nr:MarR family transcriptional regulator [Subtercola boreus]RFA20251.1 MarR family transcriptional regulator [Subtercola boreus]RFA20403.1 MarR family transcriptional regulator [Subtercola boreus]RFA26655.1 MarR family transcriptional regulator [Subtercola boreus]